MSIQSEKSSGAPVQYPLLVQLWANATKHRRFERIGRTEMEPSVSLFDNGNELSVPADIRIPSLVSGDEQYSTCLYWLDVHHADPNVIHVESPSAKTYTLGDFFDIWKATEKYTDPPRYAFLQRLQAAPAGTIHVFVNGKPCTKGYRRIVLRQHEVIAVELGRQVLPKPFSNWGSL